MSQENVEIVREAMDAYNLGDKDGWARFMDPGLETLPVPEFPEPGSLMRQRILTGEAVVWKRRGSGKPQQSAADMC